MVQFRGWAKGQERGRRGDHSRRRPVWECLERRALLAAAGGDYVLSGYRWENPGHITYSIAPDGVFWDHGTNNLSAVFDAKFGSGNWQRQIALALATWQSVANINIAQVGDTNLEFGAYGKGQGDPRFGDIRFGGYDFEDPKTLAVTYFPPPQGTTHAGDMEFNTAMDFAMWGQEGYDVYSVVLHEMGHALGLEHAGTPESILYPHYDGVQTGLGPGDVAGIRAIYGPRVPDSYQSRGMGLDWTTAIDVTASLGASRRATLGDLSLPTVGAGEFFAVTAPNVSGASLQVTAAAGNVSLLSPKVSLFDALGNLIDTAANPSGWGTNVTVGADKVVPGQRYYVAVTGATSDVFAVGGYQLQVAFAGGTPPADSGGPAPGRPGVPGTPGRPVPPAPRPTPTPTAFPDRFEVNNTPAFATKLGQVGVGVVARAGLTLHSAIDVDHFVFRNTRTGLYQIAAPGTLIRILDAAGRTLASGQGQVAIRVFRPRTPLYIQITAPAGSSAARYAIAVTAQAARPSTLHPGAGRPTHRQAARWPITPRHRPLKPPANVW